MKVLYIISLILLVSCNSELKPDLYLNEIGFNLNDDFEIKELIGIDNNESALFFLDQQYLSDSRANFFVTDIKDKDELINKTKAIDIIFHAAALKHVALCEKSPEQAVQTNINGIQNIIAAANANNVKTVIFTSSDKAVNPTNVMGASKRLSEFILQAFADQNSETCFSMVRFGNVIDSAGSVVPLFRKQIKEGGPVTVTHRSITRYFMSIPEAVQLVLQSGSMAKGGDVFVLDMGDPIKILDLAYRMIHLSGLKPIDNNNPDGDIKIKFTGLRPGEKLYEELLIGDDVSKTENPLIMRAKEDKYEWVDLKSLLDKL